MSKIKENFKNLVNLNFSIVFFISAKNSIKILILLKNFLPDRNIIICKEITKYYEEFLDTKF